MEFWKDKTNRKILTLVLVVLSISFLVNVLLKLHMYGQRTIYAGESWLSTVSSIYVQNWINEGILNLKFAMIRTFDSIEMRHFGDREVYASFLPGSLFLPFIVAKVFSLKPTLTYIEIFASSFHFIGSLITALISFLLCRKLNYSESKCFWFTFFSGFSYIYYCINFRVLSFGYYTDTSVFVLYLLFILTEFSSNTRTRLVLKSMLIFAGFFHEWFFVGITVVSIFSEIYREDGKKRVGSILLSHLGPTFLALGIYVYHLGLVDKLEHSMHRMLRRSFFNPVSASSFDNTFSALWKQLFNHNKGIMITTMLMSWWNIMESKVFKANQSFRNVFIIAFGSSAFQLLIALQHSAEHAFAGLKLLVPLSIFIPFFFDEISNLLPAKFRDNALRISLSVVLLTNIGIDIYNLSVFKIEHPIYKKLDKVFDNYGYEDLFFSYNLEILMDKYPKADIKTTKENLRPFDRVEGEPFLHYSARKQVYIIDSPEDILKMLDNRDLHGRAKVHLIFYPHLCDSYKKKDFVKNLGNYMYMVDISQEDIDAPDFQEKYACDRKMRRYGFFAAT